MFTRYLSWFNLNEFYPINVNWFPDEVPEEKGWKGVPENVAQYNKHLFSKQLFFFSGKNIEKK